VGLAADRRYRLQGSYSPEGDEVANQRLAVRRAEAVRDLLVARGLDPARLELLPVSPLPSDDPAASRVVVVSSTGPEGP
jgi:type IV pilus biogenesis protein CpaD/CtpE